MHLGADDIIDAQSHSSGELLPVPRLATMLGERGIGKDTEVIPYDAKGGFLAAPVFWMLEYFGHRTVGVLNGGFPKWTREERAVTTAVPTVARTHFPITLIPRLYASADWVLDRAGAASVVLIDVRPGKMYQAGHIPWAKNIPWKANLTEQSTLQDAETLLKHFASQSVTKDKNVVVHCQAGKAAAHSYFTLRLLGYPLQFQCVKHGPPVKHRGQRRHRPSAVLHVASVGLPHLGLDDHAVILTRTVY